MDLKFPEVLDFLQWLEDFSMDLSGKVDFTFDPVVKAQPQCVRCDVAGLDDMYQHLHYSSGSIRASGRLARARAQVPGNS